MRTTTYATAAKIRFASENNKTSWLTMELKFTWPCHFHIPICAESRNHWPDIHHRNENHPSINCIPPNLLYVLSGCFTMQHSTARFQENSTCLYTKYFNLNTTPPSKKKKPSFDGLSQTSLRNQAAVN
jgi:hypothetical protein